MNLIAKAKSESGSTLLADGRSVLGANWYSCEIVTASCKRMSVTVGVSNSSAFIGRVAASIARLRPSRSSSKLGRLLQLLTYTTQCLRIIMMRKCFHTRGTMTTSLLNIVLTIMPIQPPEVLDCPVTGRMLPGIATQLRRDLTTSKSVILSFCRVEALSQVLFHGNVLPSAQY
jgi:hypothetical protein